MNKVINNNEMKDFVGRYFIRVCKNHKIYDVFKKSFYNLMRSGNDRNPFGQFRNINEMLNKVSDFTEKEYEHHKRTNDKYEKVTMMINHMIHFFLENGGVHPKRLGMLGQEIFDMSCYGMYGEDFLDDMERMQKTHPKVSSNKEAWLLSEFMRVQKNGTYNGMYWEEFRDYYMPRIQWEEPSEEINDQYEDEIDEEEYFMEDEIDEYNDGYERR